ncbi:MAG: hypothetical protein J6K21_05825 [Bacilli bacterium]|nr:hypothetical protein [Bacilli bacterium]
MKKILISSISLLLVLGLITGCGCNKKEKIDNKTTIKEDGKAKTDTKVEEVLFSNIKLNYEGGITALEADMINNANKTKNFKVKIKLINDKNQEVKIFEQIVENLETNKKQILTTGIVGDYSYIKKVEFEIVEEY